MEAHNRLKKPPYNLNFVCCNFQQFTKTFIKIHVSTIVSFTLALALTLTSQAHSQNFSLAVKGTVNKSAYVSDIGWSQCINSFAGRETHALTRYSHMVDALGLYEKQRE